MCLLSLILMNMDSSSTLAVLKWPTVESTPTKGRVMHDHHIAGYALWGLLASMLSIYHLLPVTRRQSTQLRVFQTKPSSSSLHWLQGSIRSGVFWTGNQDKRYEMKQTILQMWCAPGSCFILFSDCWSLEKKKRPFLLMAPWFNITVGLCYSKLFDEGSN